MQSVVHRHRGGTPSVGRRRQYAIDQVARVLWHTRIRARAVLIACAALTCIWIQGCSTANPPPRPQLAGMWDLVYMSQGATQGEALGQDPRVSFNSDGQ